MIFQVKIRSSEELHLPSEQDQHARHRCFTIASDALVTFKDDLNRLSTPAKVKDVVPNLGVEMRALVSRATGKLSGECDVPTNVRNDIDQYRRSASRYKPEIFEQHREGLLNDMHGLLFPVYKDQLGYLREKLKQYFLEKIEGSLLSPDFEIRIRSAEKKCLEDFETGAQEACVPLMDWDFSDELKRCGKDLEQCVLQCIHRRREINEQAARREVS